MVNWSTVCAPKENGGLGIRDPEKVNIALGENSYGDLITGGNEWWKKEICYKYLSKNWKRCLEIAITQQTRSPIWKLLRASLPLIRKHLFWCPGNGKEIKIWDDLFSDSGKLSSIPSLDSLRTWLNSKGKTTLFDISEWNSNETWKGWNLGEVPPNLLISLPFSYDYKWIFPSTPPSEG
jgi:hypothetical protein